MSGQDGDSFGGWLLGKVGEQGKEARGQASGTAGDSSATVHVGTAAAPIGSGVPAPAESTTTDLIEGESETPSHEQAWWIELDRRGLASGHAWAPCDVCGREAMQPRDGGRRCFMTPGCKGTHRPPSDRPTPLQAYRAGLVDRGTMLANLPVVGAQLRALLTRPNDAGGTAAPEKRGRVGGGGSKTRHPSSRLDGGAEQ